MAMATTTAPAMTNASAHRGTALVCRADVPSRSQGGADWAAEATGGGAGAGEMSADFPSFFAEKNCCGGGESSAMLHPRKRLTSVALVAQLAQSTTPSCIDGLPNIICCHSMLPDGQ
jgi:hypothetical protein